MLDESIQADVAVVGEISAAIGAFYQEEDARTDRTRRCSLGLSS